MDVSIIIVNYNTCTLTRNCLKSVFEQTKDIDFEVIVSDNGSKDGSVEMIQQEFPQVILIENNANLGFGTANNRGLKIAKGKYIFYLNSDTILLNNAVKIFFNYWENSLEKDKIGALGGNLLNEKGEVIHSGGKFPRPLNEIVRLSGRLIIVFFCLLFGKKYSKSSKAEYIKDVEYVTGADLFLMNNESAYFDERFFMYYEETFLQYQLKKRGLKIFLIDEPQIIHFDGKSSQDENGSLHDFTTFKSINSNLSRIKFQKYNNHIITAFIMKMLLYLFWSLPCFQGKLKSKRKEILSV
jgi:hypothetical protein